MIPFLFFICFHLIDFISTSSPCLGYDPTSNTCALCSLNNYSTYELNSTIPKFNPLSNCLPKITTSFYENTVYIQAGAANNGNGSLTSPYPSLVVAFLQESTKIIQNLQSNVVFTVIGKTHYILRQDVPFDGYLFFRRMFVNITIKPLFCTEINWPGCLIPDDSINIYVKTDSLCIFITKSMYLMNINFIALDLPLQTGNDLTALYNTQITQCQASDLSNKYGSSPCGLTDANAPMVAFRNILTRYGFFNLERRADDQNSSNIASLQISSCVFSYFNNIKGGSGFSSLIRTISSKINVQIINSGFESCVFPLSLFAFVAISIDPYYSYVTDIIPDYAASIVSVINFTNVSIFQYNQFNIKYIYYGGQPTPNQLGLLNVLNGVMNGYNLTINSINANSFMYFIVASNVKMNLATVNYSSVSNMAFSYMTLSPNVTLNFIFLFSVTLPLIEVYMFQYTSSFLLMTNLTYNNCLGNFILNSDSILQIQSSQLSNALFNLKFMTINSATATNWLQINNVTFTNITASSLLGALFFVNIFGSTCIITNSIFQNTSGLYFISTPNLSYKLLLNNSIIANNTNFGLMATGRPSSMIFFNVIFDTISHPSSFFSIIDTLGTYPSITMTNVTIQNFQYSELFQFQSNDVQSIITTYVFNLTLLNGKIAQTMFDSCCKNIDVIQKTQIKNVSAGSYYFSKNMGVIVLNNMQIITSQNAYPSKAIFYGTTLVFSSANMSNSYLVLFNTALLDFSNTIGFLLSNTQLFLTDSTVFSIYNWQDVIQLLNLTIVSQNTNYFTGGYLLKGEIGTTLLISNVTVISLKMAFLQINSVGIFILSNLNIQGMDCLGNVCFSMLSVSGYLSVNNLSIFNAHSQGSQLFVVQDIPQINFTNSLFKNVSTSGKGFLIYSFKSSVALSQLILIDCELFEGNTAAAISFLDSEQASLSNISVIQSTGKPYYLKASGSLDFYLIKTISLSNLTYNNVDFSNIACINIFDFDSLVLDQIVIQNSLCLSSLLVISNVIKGNVIHFSNFFCLNNQGSDGVCLNIVGNTDFLLHVGWIIGNLGKLMLFESDQRNNIYLQNILFESNIQNSTQNSIQTNNLQMFMSNCNFQNNVATASLFGADRTLFSLSNLSVSVLYNSKTTVPLWIFLLKTVSQISINESRFFNVLGQNIGFLSADQSFVNINSSYFKEYDLQTFFLSSSQLNISICSFMANHERTIDLWASYVSIDDSIFTPAHEKLDIYTENSLNSINDLYIFFSNVTFFQRRGKAFESHSVFNLRILNSRFFSEMGGNAGITITNFRSLVIFNSSFSDSSKIEGGCMQIINDASMTQASCFCTDTTFSNCSAQRAGALYISGDIIGELINCSFINNKALNNTVFNSAATLMSTKENGPYGIGGGLFYHAPSSSSDNVFLIRGGTFNNNSADYFGGGIYSVDRLASIDVSSTHFINNMATCYGSSQASYSKTPVLLNLNSRNNSILSDPKKLFEELNNLTNANQTIEIKSGQELDMIWVLLDSAGQIVTIDNTTTAKLLAIQNAESQTALIDQGSAISSNGLLIFESLKLTITPHQIFDVNMQVQIQSVSIVLNVPIHFVSLNCSRGEIRQSDQTCFVCLENSFSFIDPMMVPIETQKCLPCPANTYCYSKNMLTNPGFWRNPHSYTQMVFDCKVFEQCLGTFNNSEDSQCLEGHYGVQCQGCIDGYTRSNEKDICRPCNVNIIAFVLPALSYLLILSYSLYQVMFYIDVSGLRKKNVEKNVLIKILINYIQLISLLHFIPFKWGSSVKWTFEMQGNLAVVDVSVDSMDCMNSQGGIPHFYAKTLFVIILPFVFVVAETLFFLGFIIAYSQPTHRKSLFFYILKVVGLITFYVFYPQLTKASLRLVNCFVIDDSVQPKIQVLVEDPNITCWDASHNRWAYTLGAGVFIVWGCGVPLFALATMIANKQDIKENINQNIRIRSIAKSEQLSVVGSSSRKTKTSKAKVSGSWMKETIKGKISEKFKNINDSKRFSLADAFMILYNGYKFNKFYWELINFMRKTFMIVLGILLKYTSLEIQLFCLNLYFFVFYSINTINEPFETKFLNQIERCTFMVLIFTGIMGVFSTIDSISEYNTIFGGLILLANFMMMVTLVSFILYHFAVDSGLNVQKLFQSNSKVTSSLEQIKNENKGINKQENSTVLAFVGRDVINNMSTLDNK